MKIVAWILIVCMAISAFTHVKDAVNDSGEESACELVSVLLSLLFAGFGVCYLLGW